MLSIYLKEDTAKQKILNSRAIAFKNFLDFLAVQNQNVKSPRFVWSKNRNLKGKLFKFPFGT